MIIAAGYGTGFLPVTKTVPKELLPVGTSLPDRLYIVRNSSASGIDEIIVVTSRRKKALEDYFDRKIELEEVFGREGKADRLALVAACPAKVSFVRQTEMRGTGHALLQVKSLLGGKSGVVAYPDDLHIGTPPLSRPAYRASREDGQIRPRDRPRARGRFALRRRGPRPDGISVRSFVEKPAKGAEPSHEVSIGRYLYTPEFFDLIEEDGKLHGSGEYFHTYALDRLIAAGKVAYVRASGIRLDTGDPAGYLEAILMNAAADPALRPVLEAFARERSGGGAT